MSDGFGQGPKKETVYNGPTPGMDNKAFAQGPAPGTTGTVYSGPSSTQGTVYGGPSSTTTSGAKAPVQDGMDPAVLRSANWFFWIAALSLVNSIIAMSGGNWQFFLGLGVSQVLDAIGGFGGSAGHVIALIMNLFIAGVVSLFGIFARKGQKWAFLVGMILYAGDGIIFIMAGEIRSVIFHGL